ncbi:MAG: hypothetical protein V4584_14120 [Verrucomicrobiota bacterium]
MANPTKGEQDLSGWAWWFGAARNWTKSCSASGELCAEWIRKVNSIFSLIFKDLNFFSNEFCSEIQLMWQLRHSIVHTGGVITREDCMKHPQLKGYRDRRPSFEEGFIIAVARRFHIILQKSLDLLKKRVRDALITEMLEAEDLDVWASLICGYASPRSSWFKISNT